VQLGLSFHHEAEIEGAADRFPSRLDPKLISRDELKKQAFSWGSRSDLSGFTDLALDWLSQETLDADRRRVLLSRLTRPDVPKLVDLILADLKHKHSAGFGSLTVHNLLLQDQLRDLAKREPNLLRQEAFVHACLRRLHPGPESEWRTDPEQKRAYLDLLWEFVEPLAPSFNALKSQVLYHRLDTTAPRASTTGNASSVMSKSAHRPLRGAQVSGTLPQ